MIVDRLENANVYHSLGAGIARAFAYLQSTDFSALAPGEYPIDGRDIFAIVNEYNLKPLVEGRLEAHRSYIDIQFMVRGAEQMGYAPWQGQEESCPFEVEADYGFYYGESSLVLVEEGMFALFYPQDLHMPCIGDPLERVRKVVVKVRV